jgi:hypothetical protein
MNGNLDRLKDYLPHDSLDELSDLLTPLEQSNILDTIPESHPTDTENEKSFIKGFIRFKIPPSLAESFHK